MSFVLLRKTRIFLFRKNKSIALSQIDRINEKFQKYKQRNYLQSTHLYKTRRKKNEFIKILNVKAFIYNYKKSTFFV